MTLTNSDKKFIANLIDKQGSRFEKKVVQVENKFENKVAQVENRFENKIIQVEGKFEIKLVQVENRFENKIEELEQKFEDKLTGFRDDFYTKIDPILKEVVASREERTIAAEQHRRNQDRIEKLEKIHPKGKHNFAGI